MFNVEALRDTMRAMPLPRLQAYLRQHQDDPYTVALGLSIAKDKQKAMLAQQGMAGRQPMPKVVDEAISQIAPRAVPMPEDVGIGQLPADNLRGIATGAAGGLVAFGGGGEVPRYQTGGVMAGTEYGIPGMTQSTLLQDALDKLNAGRELSSQEKALLFASKPLTAAADVAVSPINLMRRLVRNPLDTSPLPSMTPVSDARAKALGLDQQQDSYASAPDQSAAETARLKNVPAPVAPTTDKTLTSAGPTSPAAPGAPTGPRAPVGPAAPTAGIPSLISTPEAMQKAISDAQTGIKPEVPKAISEGIAGIQTAEQKAQDEYVQSIRDEQAKRQPAMKDFEQRLLQRETRLSQRERDLGPMAMLQAGMAIMGGSSPFAAVNIGAGAQVGIDRYTKGAEKLEEARDKMDEAYAKIEEVRRNESRMDAKELREAILKAKQPAIEAQKTMFNALHEDWKLKRQDAVKGVELLMSNQQAVLKEAGANARMAMQVNAPSAYERLYTTLGGGDIEKGLRKYGEIMGPEARGLPALLQKYADPVKLQTLKATDPELYNYIRSQLATQMLTPMSKPTGPVRE